MPGTRQETRPFSENATALETAASTVVITTALETAANAVVITDGKGIILWVNPAFTSLTGYTSEEVKGKNPRLLKSGKHDQQFYKNLWTTILTGKTWCGDFTNRRKDGSLYQDEHTITPVRSKDGRITHFIAIMNDVTERKRAEQALREREKELKEAQRVANVGGWKWVAQTDTFTCSEEFCRIAGCDPEGPTPRYKDGLQIFTPENWASLEPAIQRTLRTGMPYDLDLEIVRPDGTRKWITIRGEALTNAAEEIVGLRGTAQDITERKRAEASLKERETELKEAQRVAHVGSWQLDLASNQAVWSNELYRMLGLNPDLHPPPYPEQHHLFTPESWQRLTTDLDRTAKTGVPYELELEMIRSDGSTGWMLARGEPVLNRHGAIVGLRGIAQDITERKQTEEEIRQLNAGLEQRVNERTAQLRGCRGRNRGVFLFGVARSPRTYPRHGRLFAHDAGGLWRKGRRRGQAHVEGHPQRGQADGKSCRRFARVLAAEPSTDGDFGCGHDGAGEIRI